VPLEQITLADRLMLGGRCRRGPGTSGRISDLAAALGTTRRAKTVATLGA